MSVGGMWGSNPRHRQPLPGQVPGRRFHKRLIKKGMDHFYKEDEGGHTWRNWRIDLTDWLKRLDVSYTEIGLLIKRIKSVKF